MKNALNMFLEFWRLYFSSVFWMIVYLPRLMLWFLMILGPVAPIVIIGHKIAEKTGSEGFLIATNVISAGLIYYLLEHTKWGEWTKKVSPLKDYPDD